MFGSARIAAAPARTSSAFAEPSRSTGFASLASARHHLGESRARLGRRAAAASRPCASQASAQRIPSPPALVTTATRLPAARQRRQQHGRVEQLLRASSRGAPPPGGTARRRRRRSRRAQRCARRLRVRRRRARAAAHREDRLRAGDAPCDARELARVPERLEVEQHDVGLRIVLPVLEQVVRRDVGLVADRHERRQPEPARLRLLQQREPQRAALRGERDAAGRECAARERRVQPPCRRRDAQAVRADHPRAVRAHEREQLVLPRAPFGARLGETRRDDAQRPHARARSAESAASITWAPGTQIDREVDRARECPRPSGSRGTPPTGSPFGLTG